MVNCRKVTKYRRGSALFELTDGREVEITGLVSPFDPGRTHGPPEDCYPPEGGDVEIEAAFLVLDGKTTTQQVELDLFSPADLMLIEDQIYESSCEDIDDADYWDED